MIDNSQFDLAREMLILLSFILIRIMALYWFRLEIPNGDDAIAGIMAQRIHSGVDLPLFFYGQSYYIPFISYFMALVGIVAPINFHLLGLSKVIFSSVGLYCFYRVARKQSPRIALVFGLLLIIPPITFMQKQIGWNSAYYAQTLLFGGVVSLCFWNFLESQDRIWLITLSLVLVPALLSNPQVFALLLSGFLVVWWNRSLNDFLQIACAFVILTVLPILLLDWFNTFRWMHFVLSQGKGAVVTSFQNFYFFTIPKLLGMGSLPAGSSFIRVLIAFFLFCFLVTFFVYCLVRISPDSMDELTHYFVWILVIQTVVFIVSGHNPRQIGIRYLIFVPVGLAYLYSVGIAALSRRIRCSCVAFLTLIFFITHFVFVYPSDRSPLSGKSLDMAVELLSTHDSTTSSSVFHLANTLNFYANEAIQLEAILPLSHPRLVGYHGISTHQPPYTFLYPRGGRLARFVSAYVKHRGDNKAKIVTNRQFGLLKTGKRDWFDRFRVHLNETR